VIRVNKAGLPGKKVAGFFYFGTQPNGCALNCFKQYIIINPKLLPSSKIA